MSNIQLYDYQQQMVADTYNAIRAGHKRILMIAIMGAGKTILASWIMRDCVSRGGRVVFLVSLNVLIDQTLETLEMLGVHCTALQGDRVLDNEAPVVVASLQTIGSRLRRGKTVDELLGDVRLVIADEAHLTSFDTKYQAVVDAYPEAVTIGLTATPWRRSRKQWLGQNFDCCVVGPQPPDIIRRGKAVPCRGFTIGNVFDIDRLKVRAGEFVDRDMVAQATTSDALKKVVSEWKRLAVGRPTLMVGAGIQQAQMQCDEFNRQGIPSELIIGDTSTDERKAIFQRVKDGETIIICSVGCLTAGFNLPCISAILYVRATKSKALFHQTAGRGSRPAPGKNDYILLDFGKNLKRHHNPMGPQDYDISEKPVIEMAAPEKECPQCGYVMNSFLRVCPQCGEEFGCDRQVEEVDIDGLKLTEFVDKATKEKIANIRRWRRKAWNNRTSPDEPINRFVFQYGHQPSLEWMRHACLTRRYSQRTKTLFLDWMDSRCKGNRWADQWIEYHLMIEFGSANIDLSQWWDTLNLDPNASWEQIKQAYSALAIDADSDRVKDLNLAIDDARSDIDETAETA